MSRQRSLPRESAQGVQGIGVVVDKVDLARVRGRGQAEQGAPGRVGGIHVVNGLDLARLGQLDEVVVAGVYGQQVTIGREGEAERAVEGLPAETVADVSRH